MSKSSSPSWMQRVANWVFGYDYFISYAHADGSVYAESLAAALRQRGRQCFLDVDHYRIGDDWMGVGHWTLKRTTCLIVVGSPAALTSEPVAHEVRLFRSMSNQLVPIDFDGSLTYAAPDSKLHALLPETILRLREEDRLRVGPSDGAITRIIGDFKGLTQNRKRVRFLTLAVFAFAVLAVCAGYFGVVSQRNARLAEGSRVLAEQNADQARRNAEEAQHNAEEARLEQSKAEEAARKAAVESSRNSFALSIAASETQDNPWSALVLAVRAAETLPDHEAMFDLYLTRAVHLVDRLADTVINLPLSEGVRAATFSPRLDRVAIVTDNNQVHVFALPDCKPLRVPAYVNKMGCSARTPEFFDNGRTLRVYLNWFHPEPDPEEQGSYVLEAAWNVLDGTVLTPIDNGRISPDDLRWTVLRGEDPVVDQQAKTLKGLPPALRDRLTPRRGLGNIEHRIATVSADGRVMGWSEQNSTALAVATTLDKRASWVRVRFVGQRLVTLDAEDTLRLWDVSTRRQLWSRKVERIHTERQKAMEFQLSADGSAVKIEDEIINLATGQTAVKLDGEDLSNYDLIQHAVVGNRKVVSALSFYTGNSDDFLLRLRDGALSGKGEERVKGVNPRDFQGFLQDGRYLIAGSPGSFRIVDWTRGSTVAAFDLGESSRISPEIATNLLKRVTRVDTTARLVRLTVRDGPTLVASLPVETTTALLIDGATQSIAAPHRSLTGLFATQAMSADGRWLATADKGKLRVWDASNGDPLTEPIPFTGEARDLQFSADGSAVLLATSMGALIRLPVLFRWSARPAWIAGLAEALTGLTLAPDGRVVAVSPQRFSEMRAQVAAQLANDQADTPPLRLLRNRITKAMRPPGH